MGAGIAASLCLRALAAAAIVQQAALLDHVAQ